MGRIRETLLREHWIMPTLVTVVSALGLLRAQWAFREANLDRLPQGYLLQEWSSESMMQTLGLKDMFAFGPMALWYNHSYPPLQDAIRYALSLPDLVHRMPPNYGAVDLHLYVIYAWCFGLVNAIVYLWVRDLTKSGWWALIVTGLWAVNPGYLTNMMLLDPTPLAMLFLTASFYFLYRFLRSRNLLYVSAFLVSFLLASWSRNVLQIHVIPILIAFVVLAWWLSRKRSVKIQALNVLLIAVILILPAKQWLLYDTTDTSTFGGHFRVGMIWVDPHTVPEPEFPKDILGNAERFQSKWNTSDAVRDNYRLSQGATDAWLRDPLGSGVAAMRSLTITIPEALRPSSTYVTNLLVAELPWKSAYDWVFSGWRYILILIGAFAVLIWQRGLGGLGRLIRRYAWLLAFYALIAAPVLWSNRFIPGEEWRGPIWTDAVRLKMFLEVPLVVLVAYALWTLPGLLRRSRARRADQGAPDS